MKVEYPKLSIDGVVLDLRLTRKRVRNINARLVGNELRVSAPPSVPDAELDRVVRRLAGRLVRRAHTEKINSDEAALAVAKRIAERFPEQPKINRVSFVTSQRKRWGSYSSRTGNVRLNAALRQLPAWVLEAVVAHELAHAIHPDHSSAFWQLLHSVCPETDRAQAFLAGVSWIAKRWDEVPDVERSLLSDG